MLTGPPTAPDQFVTRNGGPAASDPDTDLYPGNPRAGFDFVRPYLAKVLSDTLGLDLTFVDVEFTLAASVPAMAGLVEIAETSLQTAHRRAAAVARGSQLSARAAPLAA